MADALPKPRVNDPQARDAGSLERPDTGKLAAKNESKLHPQSTPWLAATELELC